MIEKDYYTIKEIADILKISKQAVRKRVSTIDSKLVSTKVGSNTILVSREGFNLLREKVSTNSGNQGSNVGGKVGSNQVDTITINRDAYIEDLKAQIEDLKRDKETLQKDKEVLQEYIKNLEDKNNTIELMAKNQALLIETVEPKKESLISSWWNRMLNK